MMNPYQDDDASSPTNRDHDQNRDFNQYHLTATNTSQPQIQQLHQRQIPPTVSSSSLSSEMTPSPSRSPLHQHHQQQLYINASTKQATRPVSFISNYSSNNNHRRGSYGESPSSQAKSFGNVDPQQYYNNTDDNDNNNNNDNSPSMFHHTLPHIALPESVSASASSYASSVASSSSYHPQHQSPSPQQPLQPLQPSQPQQQHYLHPHYRVHRVHTVGDESETISLDRESPSPHFIHPHAYCTDNNHVVRPMYSDSGNSHNDNNYSVQHHQHHPVPSNDISFANDDARIDDGIVGGGGGGGGRRDDDGNNDDEHNEDGAEEANEEDNEEDDDDEDDDDDDDEETDVYNRSRHSPRRITINDYGKNRSLTVPFVMKLKLPSWLGWLPGRKKKPHHGLSTRRSKKVRVRFLKRKMFPDNRISTTQYWWWHYVPVNFLPLNILSQFRLVYNWYFILVMVFSLIPGVSPVFPITAILPVIFIFGINMIKDFTEDLRRYLKDRQTNRSKVHVLRGSNLLEMSTGDIHVGDIVSLSSGATIPADIVILSTSNQDNKCYVETAQLDGETNMKPKFGKHRTQHLNTIDKLAAVQGEIRCGAPVIEIHKFDAVMRLHDGEGVIEETLHDQNVILKGCTLKNTAQLYGVVVYTGADTKIMLNTAHRKWKMSFIDIKVNLILLVLILIHQLFCIVFVVLSCIKQHSTVLDSFYIVPSASDAGDETLNFRFGLYRYFTFFILLNLMIPMSLFVSLQFIKVIQAFFMERDLRMYYEEDDIPMEATASDLNADLALIDIIFSDKTGTLTNNTMVFKKMGIGDIIVHDESQVPGAIGRHLIIPFQLGQKPLSRVDTAKTAHSPLLLRHNTSKQRLDDEDKNMNVNVTLEEKAKSSPSSSSLDVIPHFARALTQLANISNAEELRQRYFMMNYLLNLVICNDLIVEDGEFSGESPDEICLADAALQNGFELLNQSEKETVVQIFGRVHTFSKIHTIGFTSDRKKMSVIVRYPQSFLEQFPWYKPAGYDYLISPPSDSPAVCFTKGADSALYPLILTEGASPQETNTIKQLISRSEQYVDQFGIEGLRTLLLCHRFIDLEDALMWRRRYIKASAVSRNTKARLARMTAIEQEMERDMDLDGATAIEDKLQENVPETIKWVLAAGIQFWVLTGDKRETSKNVTQLAGLIHVPQNREDTQIATGVFDMEVVAHPAPTEQVLRAKIQETYQLVQVHKTTVGDDICLVINGLVIGALETFPTELHSFLNLINLCKTVIVCRAIPAHKASVVRLVQKQQHKRGLAIGDGANDVSMIQSATVGIGISGKEGSQAKNAGDYALPRFFHLKRLLAVHGHYSLTRLALFVQYSFYKNIVLTFAQMFYMFYCIYSGQTIIDSWVLTFYNMIFTLAPPFVVGLFDKDIDEVILEDNPQLYKNLKETKTGFDQTLSFPTFSLWVIQAIYHAAIIFFIVIYSSTPTATESMQTDGLWTVSTMLSVNIFIVVNIKICLEMRYITFLNHLSVWLSVILFFSFLFGYSGVAQGSGNMFFVMFWLMSHGRFYLVTMLCIVACIVPDIAIKAFKKTFFPAEWEVLKMQHHKRLSQLLLSGKKSREEKEQEILYGGHPDLDQLQYNIELDAVDRAAKDNLVVDSKESRKQRMRDRLKQQQQQEEAQIPATSPTTTTTVVAPPPSLMLQAQQTPSANIASVPSVNDSSPQHNKPE